MTAYLDIPDPHSQFREYTPADITRLQRTARMREFLATQERFQDALTTYDRVAATLKANPQAKITPAQREVYDKIAEAQRALIQMRDVASTPPQKAGLQAVDYFLWALQRHYERDESRYVELVWDKVVEIEDLDRIEGGRRGLSTTKNAP